MDIDELLAWIGRMAFEIEEGRRPVELTETVRRMLEDMAHAAQLAPENETRQALLAQVAERLDALDRSL